MPEGSSKCPRDFAIDIGYMWKAVKICNDNSVRQSEEAICRVINHDTSTNNSKEKME